MTYQDKTQFNEQIRERTMNLSVSVRELLISTEIKPIDRSIVNQLIRSSSSIAANYRSATRGRSDAEFFSKICIVVEESDETLFWIDYLIRLNVIDLKETQPLRNELEQLVRLFSTIKKTMKEKLRKSGKFQV